MLYNRITILIVMVICLIFMAMPVLASALPATDPGAGSTGDPEAPDEEPVPYYKQLTVAELYEKVKECRQSLLATRLDVVKEANEAKLRLEELLKSNKHGSQSADALKKDLETIKEAQKVLATILSDIVNVTSADNFGVLDARTGQVRPQSGAQQEILPSREYLENLIVLYDEKTQQLSRIVESLNSIVPLI